MGLLPHPQGRHSKRPHRVLRASIAGAALTTIAVGASALGAAPASAAICIPLFTSCSSATPTPTPSGASGTSGGGSSAPGGQAGAPGAGPTGGAGSLPTTGLAPGATDGGGIPGSPTGSTPAASATPTPSGSAGPSGQWGPITSDDTNVYTQPAAQLGGSGITITGLHGFGLVRLRLANGGTATAIKIAADDIVITGFSLDVRGSATGPSAVETDDRMELRGNVVVYLDSATAQLPGGTTLTLGADTPPPGGELPATWQRFSLGFIGATADSIIHTNTDLKVRPGTHS